MSIIEWLAFFYLLLGSMGTGYYFLRVAVPPIKKLEKEYRTGWAIILGIVFAFSVLIITTALELTGFEQQLLFIKISLIMFVLFSGVAYIKSRSFTMARRHERIDRNVLKQMGKQEHKPDFSDIKKDTVKKEEKHEHKKYLKGKLKLWPFGKEEKKEGKIEEMKPFGDEIKKTKKEIPPEHVKEELVGKEPEKEKPEGEKKEEQKKIPFIQMAKGMIPHGKRDAEAEQDEEDESPKTREPKDGQIDKEIEKETVLEPGMISQMIGEKKSGKEKPESSKEDELMKKIIEASKEEEKQESVEEMEKDEKKPVLETEDEGQSLDQLEDEEQESIEEIEEEKEKPEEKEKILEELKKDVSVEGPEENEIEQDAAKKPPVDETAEDADLDETDKVLKKLDDLKQRRLKKEDSNE